MFRLIFAVIVISVCISCNAIKGQQIDRMGLTPLNRHEEQKIRNAKAEDVGKYMNLEADPCIDFYDFACGNWSAYHAEVAEDEIVSVQNDIEERIAKDLVELLDKNMQDNASGRKVNEFYRSCMNVVKSSDQQENFILSFIKKHGGLPEIAGSNWNVNNNWVHVLALLRANYGLDILIGLEIDTNMHTMSGNSIYLGEPRTTLIPAKHCSASVTRQAKTKDQVYEDLAKEVARNMREWYSLQQQEAERLAATVISFEFELCKQMRKEQDTSVESDSSEIVQPSRAFTFQKGQNRLHGVRTNTPYSHHSLQEFNKKFGNMINFKQYVDITFDSSINDNVFMRSESYFAHLIKTIKDFQRPTISHYIMYRALSAFALPNNNRSKFCFELVQRYFPQFIGEMYRSKIYRNEVNLEAEQLYKEVQRAFDEALSAQWIDENTRRAARQKLQQFQLHFPIYQNLDLSKLQIEHMSFWHKLERVMQHSAKNELSRLYDANFNRPTGSIEANDVEIKLNPTENVILISWGILQEPFYHFFYPRSLKFSLVAQRMARELAMAFDEEGSNRNPMKTLRWDPYTTEGFHNHSECMRKQYSNYLYDSPDEFRNATKLRELMADSAGLNIAFNAYLAWLNNIDTRDPQLRKETLRNVDFTNTQLFFINFAQTRCVTKHDNTPPPEFAPLEKHTEERYSVNGPLGNSAEFAREFGCEIGTEMNPDDKCIIY